MANKARAAHPPPWMDRFKAPLPPCTLETLPEPVKLPDGSHTWPLMLGCYRLEQLAGGGDASQQQYEELSLPASQERTGQLNLYMLKVPDVTSNLPAMPLSFGEPHVVLHPRSSSGILDGKWSSTPIPHDPDRHLSSWAYATAHSTGEVRLHALQVLRDDSRLVDSDPMVHVQATIGRGNRPGDKDVAASALSSTALCLSLHWNPHDCGRRNERQLVSGYSNGRVALHDVLFSPSGSSCQVLERDSWPAHSLFTAPSEVWSACFCAPHLVASGGDEGSVKFWDVRSTTRPTQVLRHPFSAGVTCLSPHPRLQHVLACGSYDECWALYDVRHAATPLYKSQPLGGGIWRMQWHPVNDRRLLLAVMHGGCRVVQCRGLTRYCGPPGATAGGASAVHHPHHQVLDHVLHPNLSCPSFGSELTQSSTWSSEGGGDPTQPVRAKVKKSYEEHDSMTYGAAWLVCRHPQQPQSYFEAAASCSFYDKEVMLWDSVF